MITKSQWKSKQKEIFEYVQGCKDSYRGSSTYSRLKNRKKVLRSSIDMVNRKNTFRARLYIPMVRMQARVMRAILRENFRGSPLISVTPLGTSKEESARMVQNLLEQNMRETRFRTKCHERNIGYGADYGTSVIYSQFQSVPGQGFKTILNPNLGYQRVPNSDPQKNVFNKVIDILDYGQDPRVEDPDDSSYQFHIDCKPMAAMKSELESSGGMFDKENLAKLIKAAEDHICRDSEKSKVTDYEKFELNDFCYYYGKLLIKGNEFDQTEYLVVTGGEWVIRFEPAPLDYNIRPYSICRLDPKLDQWWANGPADLAVSSNDFMNVIWNTSAENAMNALQQYVFYDKTNFPDFDTAKLNEARQNGGFIGIDSVGGRSMRDLIHVQQSNDQSLNSTNNLTAEIEKWAQKTNVNVDLHSSKAQGGMSNTTATAANITDRMGNMQQNDFLIPFANGYKDLARINVTLLQQFMGPEIEIHNRATGEQFNVEKAEILGLYDYETQSSLTRNREMELFRLNNVMNMLINAKATQDPAMGPIKLEGIVKELLKLADLPGEDTQYYDEEAVAQAEQAQAQQQQPGAQGGQLPPELAGAIPEGGQF